MFSKIFTVVALLVVADAKNVLIRNIGHQDLRVSISGSEDIVVSAKQITIVSRADGWNGKISAVPNNCVGDECNVPKTEGVIALGNNAGEVDTYSVSLKEGFNLGMKIIAIGNGAKCSAAVCEANMNAKCPVENQVQSSLGEVIACKNSPLIFNRICPRAVSTEENVLNVHSCQAIALSVFIG